MIFFRVAIIFSSLTFTIFSMEKNPAAHTGSVTVEDFFEKHKYVLNKPEGKHVYCSALMSIFSDTLRNVERVYKYCDGIHSFLELFPQADDNLYFSSIVTFPSGSSNIVQLNRENNSIQIINASAEVNRLDENIVGQNESVYNTFFKPISSDNVAKYSSELKMSYGLFTRYQLLLPEGTNLVIVMLLSQNALYEKFLKKDNGPFLSSFKALVNGNHVSRAIATNACLKHFIENFNGGSSFYFPYTCNHGCYSKHIYHLENIANYLGCIFLNSKYLFPKQKEQPFFDVKTLAMLKDLLNLIPIYKELYKIWKEILPPFLFDTQKNNCVNVIQLKQVVSSLRAFIERLNGDENAINLYKKLQLNYEIYYNSLQIGIEPNGKNRRLSPWIFGNSNNMYKTVLDPVADVFYGHLFFKLPPILTLTTKPLNLDYKTVQKELLTDYNKTPKNKKRTNNIKNKEQKAKTKERQQNKKLQNKNLKQKLDEDRLSVTEGHPYDLDSSPKDNVLSVIRDQMSKIPLVYLTAYLKKCKNIEESDFYHKYPYSLDWLVIEYGMRKQDYKDKGATCFFWPIVVQDQNQLSSNNAVYVVIQNRQGAIFHRGPVPCNNPFLYLKFAKDKSCFDDIINNAQINYLYSEPYDMKFLNYDNQEEHKGGNLSIYDNEDQLEDEGVTKINNPFFGAFPSTFNFVSDYYVTVKPLEFPGGEQKSIYFPLIMN